MTALTPNAITVLEKRYLWRDDSGKLTETPDQLFRRVARAISSVEKRGRAKWEARFYQMMADLRFMPNSPTLMNAGKKLGQLSACFVLPVGDSLEEIFETLKQAAKIHQSGGGTGFNFSRLRVRGSVVRSTHGVASGPVSFMKIYDAATETIKQGGARRGANMGILRADHPDILEFIDCKRDQASILNFNISVAATDEFMSAVRADGEFGLRSPRTGTVVRNVRAKEIFDHMVQVAWECGDPGLVFVDRINEFNPTPQLGPIESTNPCVTGDTRVLVEDAGFIPIREIVGTTPRVSTEEGDVFSLKRATQIIRTGVRPVFQLKTVEGYEIRVTSGHRIMTESGDVTAGELEAGDRVRLMAADPTEILWETPDARLGEVIGWLTGDGHFTNRGRDQQTAVLSFYGEEKKDVGPRLLEWVQQLTGNHELSLVEVEDRDLSSVSSPRLRRALNELGVDPECKGRAPEIIFRGNLELVSGYLRGLFSADGGVQGTLEKGLSVRLANNQLRLLKDAQLLLLRLGIKAVIYENRREAGMRPMPDSNGTLRDYFCQAQHELVVAKAALSVFAKTVGFLIGRKQDGLETALAGYRRGPYRQSFYATVLEVVPCGEEEVFDLSEPGTHHFHGNGILVHNCGEQPLLPYESCNLGSLNLGRYFVEGGVDWDALRTDIADATRFLDNVIDVNHFPVDECAHITRRNRKIGLGVMGFADLLLMLDIPYDSEAARDLGEKLMSFVDREGKRASAALAKEKGKFPNWKGSLWERLGYAPMRNATVSTVAPTGTISMIAGASSGIEPIFSGVFYRNVLSGARLMEVHPAVETALRKHGVDPASADEKKIASVLGRAWRPAGVVSVDDHVAMQSVFQRHSDSAVSKTVNLPESATVADVAHAYLRAYELGCKGITVYRDKSRPTQVLERSGANSADDVDACPSC